MMPKHLRFRMKAIQRRIDSANAAALQDVGNKKMNSDIVQHEQFEVTPSPSPAPSPAIIEPCMEDDAPTCTKNEINHKKLKVQFAPMARVVTIRRLSSHEINQVWYRAEEYRRFDQDRRRTVAIVHEAREYNMSIDSDRYTALGLEKYLDAIAFSNSPVMCKSSPTIKPMNPNCQNQQLNSNTSHASSINSRKGKVWLHTQEVLTNQYNERMNCMQQHLPQQHSPQPHSHVQHQSPQFQQYYYYNGYNPYCIDPAYGGSYGHSMEHFQHHHYNNIHHGFAPPMNSYSCYRHDKSVVITPAA
jgi:hypothetical protein